MLLSRFSYKLYRFITFLDINFDVLPLLSPSFTLFSRLFQRSFWLRNCYNLPILTHRIYIVYICKYIYSIYLDIYMNMFLHSSFLDFTLLSLLSTLDFDMICIYKRECEISEKRVKTTVSTENI